MYGNMIRIDSPLHYSNHTPIMDPDMLPNIREGIYMVCNHMSPYIEFQDLTPECNKSSDIAEGVPAKEQCDHFASHHQFEIGSLCFGRAG